MRLIINPEIEKIEAEIKQCTDVDKIRYLKQKIDFMNRLVEVE